MVQLTLHLCSGAGVSSHLPVRAPICLLWLHSPRAIAGNLSRALTVAGVSHGHSCAWTSPCNECCAFPKPRSQPSIYPSIHAFIHAFIHLCIHPWIHPPINPCIHAVMHASIHASSIHASTHGSIPPPLLHMSMEYILCVMHSARYGAHSSA